MEFQYSCFISYRHTKQYKGKTYTERFVEDLKAELELRVAQEVFRDIERLKGGEYYNEEIATALCRSLCMVVLYWPTYFSTQHTFCAREFKAMEALEKRRLELVADPLERNKGLIIIVALRDFDRIPLDIKSTRLCKDFEAYTLRPNMREDPDFQRDIWEISRYIADRCKYFQKTEPDTLHDCSTFRFPTAESIAPWMNLICSLEPSFVNR